MSDTDAGDDGLDKEALREELREKYERDEREREATQRMSDLLLKGATMTNSHCGTCGDPLFQQNGTTFCPSCHGSAEGVTGTVEGEDGDARARPTEGQNGRVAGSNAADATAERQPDATAERRTDATAGGQTDARTARGEPRPDDARRDEPAGAADRPPQNVPRTDRDGPGPRADATEGDEPETGAPDRDQLRLGPGETSGRPAGTAGAGLDDARRSLVRALDDFAREAAATDDPRYARECLEAAREAAETLSALDS